MPGFVVSRAPSSSLWRPLNIREILRRRGRGLNLKVANFLGASTIVARGTSREWQTISLYPKPAAGNRVPFNLPPASKPYRQLGIGRSPGMESRLQ